MPFWSQVPLTPDTPIGHLDLRTPTEYLYPYRDSPLSDYVCSVLVSVVPIMVVGLFQIRVRSVWDFNAGQVGILKAVTTTYVFDRVIGHPSVLLTYPQHLDSPHLEEIHRCLSSQLLRCLQTRHDKSQHSNRPTFGQSYCSIL